MALIQFVTEGATGTTEMVWNALSAIGTIGAVIAAVWLGLRDSRVRSKLSSRRRLVADALTAGHLRALYGSLGRLAGGPALVAGIWDAGTTPLVIAAARSIEPVCMEVEKNLHDLGDNAIHEIAKLVAAARDVGRTVRDLERFIPGITPGLADHITEHVHAEVSTLLNNESVVMHLVGGEAKATRFRLDRSEERRHIKLGTSHEPFSCELPR